VEVRRRGGGGSAAEADRGLGNGELIREIWGLVRRNLYRGERGLIFSRLWFSSLEDSFMC
jgi:hypothetical protein